MPEKNSFEIKNIAQNTPEWHQIRKKHIGASDAPVVMGIDPWRTPYKLWCEKLDLVPQQEENDAMRWGKNHEEVARHELEKQTGYVFMPAVCVKGFQLASLDGLSLDQKHQAEIKCPYRYRENKDYFSPNYCCQVQHQLDVTDKEKSLFFVWTPQENFLTEVVRDERYIKKLREKEEEFYELIMTKTPPKLTERDYQIMKGREWDFYSSVYVDIKQTMKDLEKQEEIIKKKLIELSGGINAQGSGIKLSKGYRKGNIAYQEIPELKNIDLEKYRKETTETWRIDLIE